MARPGLDKHVKFRRLVRILGEPEPHVRGYLELLWEVGYENGDPVLGDDEAVEAAAKYPGEPGQLFKALLTCGGQGKAGFIEEVPDEAGQYQIHDLYHHAPDYVRKRWERELERTRKGTTISEMRAEAGRKGGRSKRKQAEANGGHLLQNPSKRKQTEANGLPPAPAPAPAPAPEKEKEKEPAGAGALSQEKNRTERFKPPALSEVRAYCLERKNGIDAQAFIDHYEACGWRYGKGPGKPVKDWRAAVRTWENRRKQESTHHLSEEDMKGYVN